MKTFQANKIKLDPFDTYFLRDADVSFIKVQIYIGKRKDWRRVSSTGSPYLGKFQFVVLWLQGNPTVESVPFSLQWEGELQSFLREQRHLHLWCSCHSVDASVNSQMHRNSEIIWCRRGRKGRCWFCILMKPWCGKSQMIVFPSWTDGLQRFWGFLPGSC